jgi:hypothetical protein
VLLGVLIALVAVALGTALGIWLRRPRVPDAPAPSGPEPGALEVPAAPDAPTLPGQ